MKLFRTFRGRKMAGLGIAAWVCGLSAPGAGSYAQNAPAPAVIRQAPAGADAQLAARVKAALHADPNFYDIHVEVTVEDGAVVLHGLVQNNRELLEALHTATEAAQGRKVINHLEIDKTSQR